MDSSNNNSNNNSIETLYGLVWNNNYLKRIILKHLSLFNLLNININFKSIDEYKQFQYKEYLSSVSFQFTCEDLESLPPNIESVTLSDTNYITDNTISTPDHLKSLGLKYIHKSNFDSNYFKSIGSIACFDTLRIQPEQPDDVYEIDPFSIPDSVTDLVIEEPFKNGVLKKNALPRSLKKLEIAGVQDFEDGCLPGSLLHAKIEWSSKLLVNQFSTSGLVTLLLYCYGIEIGSDIRFPDTLQDLALICQSFNASLPNHLKYFTLNCTSIENEIVFPSTLVHLKVSFISEGVNRIVPLNYQNVPKNLKLLDTTCSSIADRDGKSFLPDGLEFLKFSGVTKGCSFNKRLELNQLPASLTHIDLGGKFNQTIEVNILPSNLKTLVLGVAFNKLINPSVLPPKLENLYIKNTTYSHPLIDIVATHPHIVIKSNNFQAFYQEFDSSPESLRALVLPDEFTPSIATLQLQDKSNLEYFNFGDYYYGGPFSLSDLPTINNIKTLEIGFGFTLTINLEHFKQLETIKINSNNSNAHIISSKDNNGNLNLYNLKNIFINAPNYFIKNLDPSFYHLLKRQSDKYKSYF